MPELPEVESIRRGLMAPLVGACVAGVRLARRNIVTGSPTRSALLHGGTVDRLDRRGKQLAIIARDGRVLLVHLGMSGQLLWLAQGVRAAREDHVHARWVVEPRGGAPAGTLLFRDPRRFGGLWTLPTECALHERWQTLGPDALSITAELLAVACAMTRRAIKSVLLDQRVLAGVGNIYADEALFAAGLHPSRAANQLTAAECTRLADVVRSVLARAIEAGGSTLRDYVNAAGAPGMFALQHAVYGRAGQPCLRCRTPLRSDVLGQRTTVWCGVCQPLRP